MKTVAFIVLTTLACVLQFVIGTPNHGGHHAHQHFHENKRSAVIAQFTVTETVTVVATDAVVWLDQYGQIISTEIPTATSTTSVPGASVHTAASVIASSVTSSVSSVATATAASAGAGPAVPNQGNSAVVKAVAAGALGGFSVAYDAIRDGPCRSADADVKYLADQGTKLIRIYGVGCPLGPYVDAAAKYNVKLMLGINDIDNFNSDLNKLMDMVTSSSADWAPVDTVYICNECVQNGRSSSAAVAGAVSAAKGILNTKGFTGNVICVDTFGAVMNDPVICSTSSYCAVNVHPYFDPNTSADNAGSFVRYAVTQVAARNPGKRIVVTEAGWPYAGNVNGKAVPSIENQRIAVGSIMKEFASTPGDVYLFQAWNALYKGVGYFGVERSFGLFDTDHFNGVLS